MCLCVYQFCHKLDLQLQRKMNKVYLIYISIDGQSKNDQGTFEKFAIDHKMMLRVGAVNCDDFP